MDGPNLVRLFSIPAPACHRSGLLVHDANWHDLWIRNIVPDESLAHKGRMEAGDGLMAAGGIHPLLKFCLL